MKNNNPVVDYYHTWESKLGYRWLDGIKHFGYYPEGQEKLPKREAQHLMNEQLATALSLPNGAHVLDAGCGEGGVAIHLAQKHGLKVSGIDLLDFNVGRANATAAEDNVQNVDFQIGTYMQLPFADNTFDGIYTMETLVHAPDYQKAMAELYRVLKPGGKLALFEYSIIPKSQVPAQQKQGYENIRHINRVSSMPAFNEFKHGTFASKLDNAGFTGVKERDITPRIMPMLELFYHKAHRPYKVIKALGLQDKFINTMSAVEFYKYPELWHYNIVTAQK
jgi:ubiquinone/menaquinone biosynthesis C-methylase UbiE